MRIDEEAGLGRDERPDRDDALVDGGAGVVRARSRSRPAAAGMREVPERTAAAHRRHRVEVVRAAAARSSPTPASTRPRGCRPRAPRAAG